jgi:hypothetical protein
LWRDFVFLYATFENIREARSRRKGIDIIKRPKRSPKETGTVTNLSPALDSPMPNKTNDLLNDNLELGQSSITDQRCPMQQTSLEPQQTHKYFQPQSLSDSFLPC